MRRRSSVATASRVGHTATTRCCAATRLMGFPACPAWGRRRPPSWYGDTRISTASSPAASSATRPTHTSSARVGSASRSASRPSQIRKERVRPHPAIRRRWQNWRRPTALAHPSTDWSAPSPDRRPPSARVRVRVGVTDRDARRGPLAFLLDPVALQRLEGGMLLALSLLLFSKYSGAWLLYALLILAPDLFMLGYLRGPRVGAAVYNLGHTWLLPGILAAAGLAGNSNVIASLAIIWFGHIGADRLLGYGLKLPASFQATHLGAIGKKRP